MAVRRFEMIRIVCVCAAFFIAGSAIHAQASMIKFTEQTNHLSAEIGDNSSFVDNQKIGSFSDSLVIESPHPNSDLLVTADQMLTLAPSLQHGSPAITLSGLITVSGSDFFDDGAGGLFSVGGTSHATLGFTLPESVTFDISSSISNSLIHSFVDVFLFQIGDKQKSMIFDLAESGNAKSQAKFTLEPGTYLIDAFADFSALGPGAWTGDVSYDVSFAIVPAPGSVLLLVLAALAVKPRRRRHSVRRP